MMNNTWFPDDNINYERSAKVRSAVLAEFSRMSATRKRLWRGWYVLAPAAAVFAAALIVLTSRPVSLEVSTILADSQIPIVSATGERYELSIIDSELASIDEGLGLDDDLNAALDFRDL